MAADPEDVVEIRGGLGAHDAAHDTGSPRASGPARPYLRLWFACANQYARAYKLPCGTAYSGRCPSCGQSMRFGIGPGGSRERFFQVTCR
ncbi:MAG: hypothetical protein ACKVS8_07055 [Phycisphaerales bacterium]